MNFQGLHADELRLMQITEAFASAAQRGGRQYKQRSLRQPMETCAEVANLLKGYDRLSQIIEFDILLHASIHDLAVWERIIRQRFTIHEVPQEVTDTFIARLKEHANYGHE